MKNIKKKAPVLVLSAALAVLFLSACGSSAGFDSSAAASDGGAEIIGEIVDAESGGTYPADDAMTEESAEGEHEPVRQTLTISAVGDCTLGVTQNQSYSGSFNEYYDARGEDYFFDGVRDIFESDDMTVVNLECVLTTATERVEKTFNLKGKPGYVGILTGSSIEACAMGNNHTMDYGDAGFDETKSVLEDAGLMYAYSDQTGTYVTDDGVAVGMVSANLISESADKVSNMKSQIQELKNDGAEVVIACCHWGIEKDYYPTTFQQETARGLIDAGADVVLGSHPHVLQGVEVYNGKVICYSLGNFCFGGNKNPSDKNTMIYQQTFTLLDGEVQTEYIDAGIIPCRLSSADGYNDFHPTVAAGDTKANIISLVNEYSSPWGTAAFDDEGKLIEE